MKAGMNGALSFSTIDGWWDEATQDADPSAAPIGFSIGTDLDYEDESLQDELDAASIYEVLENEIVPRFYDRDEHGVPTRWLASVKQSMSTLAPTWDSLRMTRDYAESYYLPGMTRVRVNCAPGERVPRATGRATCADCARAGTTCASKSVPSRRARKVTVYFFRSNSASSSRRT